LYTLATNNENEIATTEGVSAGANSSQGVNVIILVFKLYVVTTQTYHQTVAGVLEARSQNLHLLSKLSFFYEYHSKITKRRKTPLNL
jgi:hypothetical protein